MSRVTLLLRIICHAWSRLLVVITVWTRHAHVTGLITLSRRVLCICRCVIVVHHPIDFLGDQVWVWRLASRAMMTLQWVTASHARLTGCDVSLSCRWCVIVPLLSRLELWLWLIVISTRLAIGIRLKWCGMNGSVRDM